MRSWHWVSYIGLFSESLTALVLYKVILKNFVKQIWSNFDILLLTFYIVPTYFSTNFVCYFRKTFVKKFLWKQIERFCSEVVLWKFQSVDTKNAIVILHKTIRFTTLKEGAFNSVNSCGIFEKTVSQRNFNNPSFLHRIHGQMIDSEPEFWYLSFKNETSKVYSKV